MSHIKGIAKKVINRVPVLGGVYRKYKFQKRWQTELRLLDGEDFSESTHPSVLHLTLNRSASQWVKSVLRRSAVPQGLVHVRWNEMAFHSEYPYLDKLGNVREYEQIFHPKGYLYSAYGGYPKGIPELEKYRVVLVLRDPRDILVSRYFSKRNSHPVPPRGSDKREKFLKDRALAQQVSIDDFVLEKQADLCERYEQYIDHLLVEHPDVYVTRYEDMVTEVDKWLEDLLEYVELTPPEEVRMQIVEEARSIQTKEEDASNHYRKGRSGDHLDKLRPATIAELNDTFRHVLDRFGYSNH